MKSDAWRELKIFGLLFITFFFILAIGFFASFFLAVPLIVWLIKGVLHFPVSVQELFRFGYFVLGMSFATTIVIWFAGKWKGRW